MFLVVAKKSRTFYSLPYSSKEQVCRSWKVAQPARQPKLTNRNIPYHGHHTQFTNGGWPGDRSSFFHYSFFYRAFELFQEVSLFRGVLRNSQNPQVSCSTVTAQGLATQLAIRQWEKNCIDYCLVFIFSSSSSNISILLCCFIKLSVSQTTSFTFRQFSSPSHCRGKGGVSEWLSGPGCLLWVEPWHRDNMVQKYIPYPI